jgi:hypothetical protein
LQLHVSQREPRSAIQLIAARSTIALIALTAQIHFRRWLRELTEIGTALPTPAAHGIHYPRTVAKITLNGERITLHRYI